MRNKNELSRMIAVIAAACLSGSAAEAGVVWSDDFTGSTPGNAPQRNFVIPTGNDWSIGGGEGITQTVASVGGSNAYSGLDSNTSVSSSSSVSFARFGAFDTSLPEHSTFTVAFDFRVDSFVASSNVSTFRVTVQDQYNNGANRARAMTVGLGYANIDGVAGNELFLMADARDDALSSASTISPLGSTAIGWNGTSFAPDFNLGQYASGDASSNDTNDEFYRFTLTFTDGSRTVAGTATRLSTGATVDFTRTLAGLETDPGFSFKGGSLAGSAPIDAFQIVLPQSGVGQMYVDNIAMETSVPEPAMLGIFGLSALGLMSRRKRWSGTRPINH